MVYVLLAVACLTAFAYARGTRSPRDDGFRTALTYRGVRR